MAHDPAKRLKKLNEKGSVDTAWFSTGKSKFNFRITLDFIKVKDDLRIMGLKGWMELQNIEWSATW